MPNLDRFSQPIENPAPWVNVFCSDCGGSVRLNETVCPECQEQRYMDHCANMSWDEAMDTLAEIFDGDEVTIRANGGVLEVTYHSTNELTLAKAKKFLKARGAREVVVTCGSVVITLSSGHGIDIL